jgi:hypothetical protein
MGRGGGAAVLGLRTHSGWAALVALAGDPRSPVVVDRRRIEMADARLAGSVQPYHHAEGQPLAQAERVLDRLRQSAQALALRGLGSAVEELRGQGWPPAAAVVLSGAGRLGSSLAQTLASHALIHTADGEHFRNALAHACEALGLEVLRVPEREAAARAATALGCPPAEIQERAAALGKPLGPPWTADQKAATLAAWTVLADGPRAAGSRAPWPKK